MESRTVHIGIPLSLIIHAIFLVLVLFYSRQNSVDDSQNQKKWIEIQLTPAPNQRIVESKNGAETEKAAPNAFLGKKTRTVVEEKVSPATPAEGKATPAAKKQKVLT